MRVSERVLLSVNVVWIIVGLLCLHSDTYTLPARKGVGSTRKGAKLDSPIKYPYGVEPLPTLDYKGGRGSMRRGTL